MKKQTGRPGRPSRDPDGGAPDLFQGRTVQRWTPQRKAALVAAVRSGRSQLDDVLVRFEVTEIELDQWSEAFNSYGIDGLKVTKRKGASRPASADRIGNARDVPCRG